MKMRKLVSLLTLWSFLMIVWTGIILFLAPPGRVAYWADWRVIGLSKTQWGNLHVTASALFSIAGVWHLVLNGKAILLYLRRNAVAAFVPSIELLISLSLAILLCFGTYLEWPPFQTLVNLGETVKDAGSEKYGEPPYGHAELSSLRILATRMQLDLQAVETVLEQKGIKVARPEMTILEIAKANHASPSEIYRLVLDGQPQKAAAAGQDAMPVNPTPGFGRLTLKAVVEQFDLNGPAVMKALEDGGFQPDPLATMKDIADKAGKNPMVIYEIIRSTADPE